MDGEIASTGIQRRYGDKGDCFMTNIKASTRVLVRKWWSDPGQGLTYFPFHGTLLEDCNGEGWDVVDVRRSNGKVTSVYSFSVEKEVLYEVHG